MKKKKKKKINILLSRYADLQIYKKLWNETVIFKIYNMSDKKQDMVEQIKHSLAGRNI